MLSERAVAENVRGVERIMGTAALVGMAYEGRDLETVFNALLARVGADPTDAAALLDISVMLEATGQREKGLEVQAMALALSRLYERQHGTGEGLRVLVFVTAGDLMANTPIDFLLEGSNARIYYFYVDAAMPALPSLPAHDVAFLAVGESAANAPVLLNLKRLLADWKGPIVNNAPENVLALTRDGVAGLLAGAPAIVAPPTVRLARTDLEKIAKGEMDFAAMVSGFTFPLIVRPLGTHAGIGMERIADVAALGAYLADQPAVQFYVAPFIEYAGPDGLYRKQRIAFIDGKAYASHWATSEHWMVHYLSARMSEFEDRRREEADWMETFDTGFALRHREAFAELVSRIGLDYFAIDCAELPDRTLLLFEADVAMIVHAMDSETTFPYKKPAMQKLFAAFHACLGRRAGLC